MTVSSEVSENQVRLVVPTAIYPQDAILSAAYVFIDRCFVLLDVAGDDGYAVILRGRKALDGAALESLAGEFGNELLAQVLRQRIAEQNRPLLEAVVAHAIGGAMGQVPAEPEFDLAALEALDLDDESFDDPLGIAVSWEDKYGDKRVSKAEAAAAKEAAAKEAGITGAEE